MPLFGKSQKSPAEVVKALKEAVTSLEKGDKKLEKVREQLWNLRIDHTYLWIFFKGTRRCKQEFTFDQEHAVWYFR